MYVCIESDCYHLKYINEKLLKVAYAFLPFISLDLLIAKKICF